MKNHHWNKQSEHDIEFHLFSVLSCKKNANREEKVCWQR